MGPGLVGPGVWAYDGGRLRSIAGGSLEGLGPHAAALGFKWIAMKGGEDAHDYGSFTPALLDAWWNAGVEPVFWWYSRPKDFMAQAAMVAKYAAMGVRAFVMDAETEWEADRQTDGSWKLHDYRAEAIDFAKALKSAAGNALLADAPWPIPSAHTLWPFKEFGTVMDLRMPQAYYAVAALDRQWPVSPTESDLENAARKFLSRFDLEWSQLGGTVCPIISNVNGNGSKRCALVEFQEAFRRYAARPAWSVWSLEWLNSEERDWLARTRIEQGGDAIPAA